MNIKRLEELEIAYGSGTISAAEVLKELGYADPEELRRLRMEEDKEEIGQD